MSQAEQIEAGRWVEITQVILSANQRAEATPAETRATDLIMKVRGFLLEPASLGQQVTIQTLAERTLEGVLSDANPRWVHDFGEPVPELLQVGMELRRELRKASEPATGGKA